MVFEVKWMVFNSVSFTKHSSRPIKMLNVIMEIHKYFSDLFHNVLASYLSIRW